MFLKRRYLLCFALLCALQLRLPLAAQEQAAGLSTVADTLRARKLMQAAGKARALQPDSAISLLQESLQISRMLGHEDGIASALLSMAFCYQDKGDYDKTQKLLQLAYPHCLRISEHNKRILPALYNGWGGTYNLMGNNDSAIHFFYKALTEITQNGSKDSIILAQVYDNLGVAWMQKGALSKSIGYMQQAENIAVRIHDATVLPDIYINKGLAWAASKDSARAMQYLGKARLVLLKQPQNRSIKFVYYAMGNVQSDLNKAIPYYRYALAYDSTSGFAAGMYQAIGSVYYRLGDLRAAAPYYLKAQQVCTTKGLVMHRIANYSALSAIYGQLGQYEQAYRYQVAYADLNDSLQDVAKAREIAGLELKYRTAEKDKELAQNKALLYRLQRGIILGTATGLLLLGVAAGFWRSIRLKQKLQAAQIRDLQQQQKIEQLHAKMQGEEEERSRIARELHDGVNVLLSATKMNYAALGKEHKGLPDTKTYGEIMSLLNHMGLELRTITYKLVPELLIQQSLPDAIETFCELIQKSNRLHIELQTFGSFTALKPEFCFAVYRVVQELVHNIVKHSGATQVLIALLYQDDLLQLTVEDNGNGFDTSKTMKGLGLESIRSRVKDLGGHISFNSRSGEGTSVELEVSTLSCAQPAR
ncbi:tetratricopeptide repeat-containing sensor histidine kinase [Taibaiella koreensis]|uniref:tetratricopeptide repeat-containing sensor histidine kinase n=1 Tax=Taibaiella koreensis TaxID=1268548 RepID=UPI000E59A147|nr:sensor histidine kinase [Taibaiella koreensis]